MNLFSNLINFKIRLLPALAMMPLLLLFCYIPVSLQKPLDTPTGVSAIAVSESRIDVAWSDISQDAQGFIVERTTDGESPSSMWIEVNNEDITLFSDKGLNAETEYFYRVRAYNSETKSFYSSVVSATTLAAGTLTPDTPTQLQTTSVNASSVSLSWNDNSDDEIEFRIYRAAGTSGEWQMITSVAADTESYIDSGGLSENTTYRYRVCAYNSYGSSPYSNEVTAVTSIEKPDAPSDLSATSVSSSQINLTWTDNSDNEAGFRIYISTDGKNFTVLKEAASDAESTTSGSLDAEKTYYYRVTAFNYAGNSGNSNIANATTQEIPLVIPAAPSNLTATAVSSSQINLTWTDNSANESGFRIERAPDSGGNPSTWGDIAVTTANVKSYSNSGLASSTKYHYRVRAYNSAGNSGYSAIISATTLTAGSTIADYLVAKDSVLRAIPDEYIDTARSTLRIAYFHTSHGTHVSYGVFGLPGFKSGDDVKFGVTNNSTRDSNKLDFHDYGSYGLPTGGYDDLSQADNGSWSSWLGQVRTYLDDDANDYINVMMWSWCDITNHNVSNYLASMEALIGEYGPGGSKIGTGSGKTKTVPVIFIFMTGHAVQNANTGTGRPKDQAQLIVDFCSSHNYYCLDYYSIDTHTMDDVYYEDTNDDGVSATAGSFYINWQNAHVKGTDWYENRTSPGETVSVGQHNNQHITSNRKAFAFWWILARLAGWDVD